MLSRPGDYFELEANGKAGDRHRISLSHSGFVSFRVQLLSLRHSYQQHVCRKVQWPAVLRIRSLPWEWSHEENSSCRDLFPLGSQDPPLAGSSLHLQVPHCSLLY